MRSAPGTRGSTAFTLLGPMLVGALWRETLQPVGGTLLDLEQLASRDAEAVLGGLLVDGPC